MQHSMCHVPVAPAPPALGMLCCRILCCPTVCPDVSSLQDTIVPIVMPFVTDNIGKNTGPEDWRLREAATLAFGSILEGPSPAALADIVRQAMGFLLAVSNVLSRHLWSHATVGGLQGVRVCHSSTQVQGVVRNLWTYCACHHHCVV